MAVNIDLVTSTSGFQTDLIYLHTSFASVFNLYRHGKPCYNRPLFIEDKCIVAQTKHLPVSNQVVFAIGILLMDITAKFRV